MRFSSAKCTKIRYRPGLCPGLDWGAYSTPQTPNSINGGFTAHGGILEAPFCKGLATRVWIPFGQEPGPNCSQSVACVSVSPCAPCAHVLQNCGKISSNRVTIIVDSVIDIGGYATATARSIVTSLNRGQIVCN